MPDRSTISAIESPFAIPPRFWWLKRIGVGTAALLIALLGLRLWWGYMVDRRLQAEIDRILAAGEPLFPADFNSPPIPDERNAAVMLKEAASRLRTRDGRPFSAGFRNNLPRVDWNTIEWVVENNQEAIRLVRQARARPEADWNIEFWTPAYAVPVGGAGPLDSLARFLSCASQFHHQNGNDAEAIELLRDMLTLTRVAAARPGTRWHELVHITRSTTARSVESIAPTLMIEATRPKSGGDSSPASRSSIEALIAELLDESALHDAWIRALHVARMIDLDTMYFKEKGDWRDFRPLHPILHAIPTGMARAVAWPVKPLARLRQAHVARHTRRLLDAADVPDWPNAKPFLSSSTYSSRWSLVKTVLYPLHLPPYVIGARQEYGWHVQSLARTRMAAIALAIRLYDSDHGHLPTSLNDLVPRYLEEIPADPFGTNGRAFGYLPNAALPRLYSINMDGVDDAGQSATRRDAGRYWLKDLPFCLAGNPADDELTPGLHRDINDGVDTDRTTP